MKEPISWSQQDIELSPSQNSPDKPAISEKSTTANHAPQTSPPSDTPDRDEISPDAQAGVQDVEALAKVWTRNHLILAYITYVNRLPHPVVCPS